MQGKPSHPGEQQLWDESADQLTKFIQGTRIVAGHALQTKWGGQLTWKAEYSVAYSVASREYAIWADSGIRSESEDGVHLALPRSLPSCRVRYKPETPGISIAD